jgi:protein SCO1
MPTTKPSRVPLSPGKWLLIYFGYTHCSNQCPTALSAMAEAPDEIGPAAG